MRAAADALHRYLPKFLVGVYRTAAQEHPAILVAVQHAVFQAIWKTSEQALSVASENFTESKATRLMVNGAALDLKNLRSQLNALAQEMLAANQDAVNRDDRQQAELGDLRIFADTTEWMTRETKARCEELLGVSYEVLHVVRENRRGIGIANRSLDQTKQQLDEVNAAVQLLLDRQPPQTPALFLPEAAAIESFDHGISRYLYSNQRVPLFRRESELAQITAFLNSEYIWQLWVGEAGCGKTRLAHEVCLGLVEDHGWYAGRLLRGDESDRAWLRMPLERDTLVVIDYVAARPEATGQLLAEAMYRRGEWSRKGKRLKFLLLERTIHPDWANKVTGQLSRALKQSLRLGEHCTPAEAEAYRKALAELDQGARDRDEERSDWLVYPRSVADSEERRVGTLLLTLDYLWREKHHGASPDQNKMQELASAVYDVDRLGRPLFAAIVVDLITRHGIAKVQSWSRPDLLQHVLAEEKQSWQACGVDDAHLNLFVLARLVNGLRFDPGQPILKELIRQGLLPAEPSTRARAQLRGLAAETGRVGGTQAEDLRSFWPAIEPDLLGEAFVLARLAGKLQVSEIDEAAANLSGQTEDLVCAAWSLDALNTGLFTVLSAQNFGNEPVLRKLLGVLPDLQDPGVRKIYLSAYVDWIGVLSDDDAVFADELWGTQRQIVQQDFAADAAIHLCVAKAAFNLVSALGKKDPAGAQAVWERMRADAQQDFAADAAIHLCVAKAAVNLAARLTDEQADDREDLVCYALSVFRRLGAAEDHEKVSQIVKDLGWI